MNFFQQQGHHIHLPCEPSTQDHLYSHGFETPPLLDM